MPCARRFGRLAVEGIIINHWHYFGFLDQERKKEKKEIGKKGKREKGNQGQKKKESKEEVKRLNLTWVLRRKDRRCKSVSVSNEASSGHAKRMPSAQE